MASPPNFTYPDPISPLEAPLYTFSSGDDVNVTFKSSYLYALGLYMICGTTSNNFSTKNFALPENYAAYSFGSLSINASRYTVAKLPGFDRISGPICQFVFGDTIPESARNETESGFFNFVNGTGNPTVWSLIPTSTSSTITGHSTRTQASTTSPPTSSASASSTLTSGAFGRAVGVGIGVGVPLALLLAMAFLFYLRWRKNHKVEGISSDPKGFEKPELDGAGKRSTVAEDQDIAPTNGPPNPIEEVTELPGITPTFIAQHTVRRKPVELQHDCVVGSSTSNALVPSQPQVLELPIHPTNMEPELELRSPILELDPAPRAPVNPKELLPLRGSPQPLASTPITVTEPSQHEEADSR